MNCPKQCELDSIRLDGDHRLYHPVYLFQHPKPCIGVLSSHLRWDEKRWKLEWKWDWGLRRWPDSGCQHKSATHSDLFCFTLHVQNLYKTFQCSIDKAKKKCVFTVTCWKKVGRSEIFFIYFFITELMWETWMHFYTVRVTFNLFLSK